MPALRIRSVSAASSFFLSSFFLGSNALPLTRKGILDGLPINELCRFSFDSPAFQDPTNPSNLLIELQAFVSLRSIDASGVIDAISGALDDLGLDISDGIDTVTDRLTLFAAVGLPDQGVDINVGGCNARGLVKLGDTSLRDLGMVFDWKV